METESEKYSSGLLEMTRLVGDGYNTSRCCYVPHWSSILLLTYIHTVLFELRSCVSALSSSQEVPSHPLRRGHLRLDSWLTQSILSGPYRRRYWILPVEVSPPTRPHRETRDGVRAQDRREQGQESVRLCLLVRGQVLRLHRLTEGDQHKRDSLATHGIQDRVRGRYWIIYNVYFSSKVFSGVKYCYSIMA